MRPTTHTMTTHTITRFAFLLFLFSAISLLAAATSKIHAETTMGTIGQSSDVFITNATIIPEPGKKLTNASLHLRDGLVVEVGRKIEPPTGARVIDASGMFVYAGFIDAGTSRFLSEDVKPEPQPGQKVDFLRSALATTRKDNRNFLTPEFQAVEALKLDAGKLGEYRAAGFAVVHVIPTGRVASGTGTLLNTSHTLPRDAILMETTMGEMKLYAPDSKTYPTTLMGATAHLRQAFVDCQYSSVQTRLFAEKTPGVPRPSFDPALEALQRISTSEIPVCFRVKTRDDIHRALDFAEISIGETPPEKLVLWGADEAHRVVDRLGKTSNVALILDLNFGKEPTISPAKPSEKLTAVVPEPTRVQQEKRNRWCARVRGLQTLYRQQIPFAVSSEGMKKPDTIMQDVRRAIEFGLPAEAALAALTTNPAKILGMEDRLGVIQKDYLASVVILNGPLENTSSKPRYLIWGEQVFEYNNKDARVATSESKKVGKPSINLTGKWEMTILSDAGETKAILEIDQSESKLNGTFTSEQGNGRITFGQTRDETFQMTIAIGIGAQALHLKISGTMIEGKVAGELRSAFGTKTKWKAERVKQDVDDLSPEQRPEVKIEFGADDGPELGSSTVSCEFDRNVPLVKNEQPTELHSDRVGCQTDTGGDLFIRNGTVLTGAGRRLEETSILIQNGKISGIGRDIEPPKGVQVIDASEMYVMPGIIDPHSHIMLTGGGNEYTQSIVPEVRIQDILNTDDTSEYRALSGGVTTVRLLHGSANVIGGQDAVVKLKYGRSARDHLLKDAPQGVKFALGENVKRTRTRFPNTRLGVEATLNRAFMEAIDYRRRWQEYRRDRKDAGKNADQILPPRRDLRLEALTDIINHEMFIHAHCYRADEILMLMRVASNHGLRIWSLQHVLEGFKIAPEIVRHGASCATFSDWWAYKVEAFDATAYNAALLNEAGANVTLKSDDRQMMRHMFHEAAKTLRYGNMSPDDAIQTITINPARELGLSDRIGSIEMGKDGDLALFNGHPLNGFSRCEITIVEGEIFFSRKAVPSAMSEQQNLRVATLSDWSPAPLDLRKKTLDLTQSDNRKYAIVGATLFPVDASPIPNGVLLIAEGKISAIGRELRIPDDYKRIDASGLNVYPGLIDSGTTLGLTEIRYVEETNDTFEAGDFQPDLKAGVALNSDSELIPVARAGGITTILMRPLGGIIAGQSSVAKLSGWTTPEMVINDAAGLQINMPTEPAKLQKLKTYLSEMQTIIERYQSTGNNQPSLSDLRIAVLENCLAGKKPVFVEANTRQEIAQALLLADEYKLRVIITGGTDAWKLAGELKRRDIPVIVGDVSQKPTSEYDPFDAPYANAAHLHDAGVRFCIRSNNASNSRNAPFEAALAVAFGLPEEIGIRSVTLSAAEILGLEERMGSLTIGKDANLIICVDSPLQQSGQIKATFIDGQPFAPQSRQTRLYERYRQRLREVQATQRVADPNQTAPEEQSPASR